MGHYSFDPRPVGNIGSSFLQCPELNLVFIRGGEIVAIKKVYILSATRPETCISGRSWPGVVLPDDTNAWMASHGNFSGSIRRTIIHNDDFEGGESLRQ
jgi:hypothetical protein